MVYIFTRVASAVARVRMIHDGWLLGTETQSESVRPMKHSTHLSLNNFFFLVFLIFGSGLSHV